MRPHGKIKLGFFPLPVAEAERLRSCLKFSAKFSALDPCVGGGRAFAHLVKGNEAYRYGVEIDANRVEQAMNLGMSIGRRRRPEPHRSRSPMDQPYGDRNAGVKDNFGNKWYIATHIRHA